MAASIRAGSMHFVLEPLEHRPHNVFAAHEHFLNVGVDLLLEAAILADVAVELDFHRQTAMRMRCGDYKIFRQGLNSDDGGVVSAPMRRSQTVVAKQDTTFPPSKRLQSPAEASEIIA